MIFFIEYVLFQISTDNCVWWRLMRPVKWSDMSLSGYSVARDIDNDSKLFSYHQVQLEPVVSTWKLVVASMNSDDYSIVTGNGLVSSGEFFHPTRYWVCDCVSILGLKLIHVSKMVPGRVACNHFRRCIITPCQNEWLKYRGQCL